ncbi:MAG: hypothetical protein ACI3VE_04200 [Oscillospiraceae bacterium]
MIYASSVMLVASFIWMLVKLIKNSNTSVAVAKGKKDFDAVWTHNQELFMLWLLISCWLLTLYVIDYFIVFKRGTVIGINAGMIKTLAMHALLFLLRPFGILIIAVIAWFILNRNQRAKAGCGKEPAKTNKKLMAAVFAGYFVVVVACTVGIRLDVISAWAWFSMIIYGSIIALGLLGKALRQQR